LGGTQGRMFVATVIADILAQKAGTDPDRYQLRIIAHPDIPS